mgnify:CR=1 FL=1
MEDFIILENDLCSLYDIALNKYSILVDVHYRTGEHKLPTKQQIIDYNVENFENINKWIYPQDISFLYRIGYTKKIVGDSVSETILYNDEIFPLNEKMNALFHLELHSLAILLQILENNSKTSRNKITQKPSG